MGLTGIPPAAFMREGDPTDPRSMRTRSQLLAAYEQLLESGSTPTVAELVRVAGVSRSSFYTHFAGIEDVGVAALRSVLDAFDPPQEEREPGRPVGPTAASFRDLFGHLAEHRDLCVAVLVLDGQMPALAELHGALVAHLVAAIEQAPAKPVGFDVQRGARFLVGGILALLHADLQAAESDVDDVAQTIAAMLPDWLARDNLLDAPLSVSPSAGAAGR
ncbi:hypothetical protein ASD65_00140 [Microbacterium sp. Root61]|uniref:TetR/AcrR family transcriptional regulator n=1 Tax=Microbacterium sp. Root61 TaxID=1736570 RepID=UPI0007000089|nr:TetR/AcrR family transcriptional regulator [Microbacterium sp. Root61]KRA23006.1 hypothetical protein ASD65_00140 [Microbacterium sp. Root61]